MVSHNPPVRMGVVLSALLLAAACWNTSDPANDYAGLYVSGPLAVTEVVETDGYVAVRPPHWSGRPYFADDGNGRFVMTLPHVDPDRWVEFEHADSDTIGAINFNGLHPAFDGMWFERLEPGEETPASLFLRGRAQDAAELAVSMPDVSADAIFDFAYQYLQRYPARTADSLTFLTHVRQAFPEHSGLMMAEGLARIAVGDRETATPLLQRALAGDPGLEPAADGLRRLTLSEPAEGEGYRAVLPFPLADVFAPPLEDEINAARADWARRDLSVRAVQIVHEYSARISGRDYQVRILSYTYGSTTHFGAVFVPVDAGAPLPVVIDARGVDPAYSPMDLQDGTQLLRALGGASQAFAVLVPAMNGHTLIADGREFQSSGDPSEAWDGATDATLAFLNAAFGRTPEADTGRIAAFGHSRGGTVALLAGVRDARISLVLSVAGPVDHFRAQAPTTGWTNAEIQMDAMSDGRPATLDEEGGQDFDHFLHRVVDEGESLALVRRRLIASSPIYFADSLPETYAFYGGEDRSVPLANALLLDEAFAERPPTAPPAVVTVFMDLGHDTDSLQTWRQSVEHLERWASR